jgi:hypothetical protein
LSLRFEQSFTLEIFPGLEITKIQTIITARETMPVRMSLTILKKLNFFTPNIH